MNNQTSFDEHGCCSDCSSSSAAGTSIELNCFELNKTKIPKKFTQLLGRKFQSDRNSFPLCSPRSIPTLVACFAPPGAEQFERVLHQPLGHAAPHQCHSPGEGSADHKRKVRANVHGDGVLAERNC